MSGKLWRGLALASALCVSGTVMAGWPLHGHRGDCGCGHKTVTVVQAAPVVHAAPVADCGCACAAAVAPCCGIGGGVAHLGNVYGLGMSTGHGWSDNAGGHYGPSHHAFGASSGGGLTGYEGLPNMDGGGTNHRYPYHSYRRPWAHPGPPSTNVSIVW